MGLAERRALVEVKENQYKLFETELKNICGKDIKIDFDWATIENHERLIWICENDKFNYFIFEPILTALRSICSDNMGKEAVLTGLNEIKMIPKTGDLDFTAGVLTVRNDLTGNGAYNTDRIRKALEAGL